MMHRKYLDNHRVAVVCSARSGSTKAMGTTNLLLRAAGEAIQRNRISGTLSRTPSIGDSSYFWGRPQAQDAFNSNSPPSTPLVGFRARGYSSPRSTSPSPFQLTPISSIVTGQGQPYIGTVDLVKSEHIAAAMQSVRDPALLKDLIGEIENDCDNLRSFLAATQVTCTVRGSRYGILDI